MLARSGEITPPWGVPEEAFSRSFLHHPGLQPLPQELQYPPVRDPPPHELHQLPLIQTIEVLTNIPVDDVSMAATPLQADHFQRVRGSPLRPESKSTP